jgi:hypothetical protein
MSDFFKALAAVAVIVIAVPLLFLKFIKTLDDLIN